MDNTIKILEERSEAAGAEALRTLGDQLGDSVNVWDKARFMVIRPYSPARYVTYQYSDTADLSRGDSFTLRANFTGVTGSPEWTISAEYDDGSFELMSRRFSGDGWHEMAFYTDSLRTPLRIFGSIGFDKQNGIILVDSIQLIHRSLEPQRYSQRGSSQKYNFESKKKHIDNEAVAQ